MQYLLKVVEYEPDSVVSANANNKRSFMLVLQVTLHIYCMHSTFCLSYFGAERTGDGMGRVILAGGAIFGVGSLCFYGLGLSGETGAIDRAGYVHQQLYKYFVLQCTQ